MLNGVDVAPLVEAELDRRDPDRAKLRPTDAGRLPRGVGRQRAALAGTVERARGCDPELLHESVDGEWSFIETLRHLAFASESWVAARCSATPPPGTRSTCPGTAAATSASRGTARPRRSLDEALALRRDGWHGPHACSTG